MNLRAEAPKVAVFLWGQLRFYRSEEALSCGEKTVYFTSQTEHVTLWCRLVEHHNGQWLAQFHDSPYAIANDWQEALVEAARKAIDFRRRDVAILTEQLMEEFL